jgi:cellulose synthase/poly-beta-1,6-N-acetylglucosamine synthase-like glycosyltransferase
VILPARNAAGTIAQQLAGLVAQDYTGGWELLVVDDRSTDRTREVVGDWLRSLPSVRLIGATGPPQPNRASQMRNLGVAAAKGDLIAFCDADDVVAPGWLRVMAEAATSADIVSAAREVNTLNTSAVRGWHSRGQRPRSERFLPWASTSGSAVWRDVLAAIGGFNEQHPGAEDRDLSWRAQLAGYRLIAAPDAVVSYRYRSRLGATARQEYRWGRADARLFRDFAAAGMRRTPLGDAVMSWAWALCTIPALPFSARRRGQWTRRTARLCGRLAGSARERVLFL